VVQVWKKVEETIETEPDTGDILIPLRRVKCQYLARAVKHELSGKPERAEYYREQAENVGRLIEQ